MVESRTLERGFTIVELLIVIVVIGILAAIVIVAYNGVTGRAYDDAVKSNLVSLAKQMNVYEATNGAYPNGSDAFYDLGIRVSKQAYNTAVDFNLLVCMNATSRTFGIIAESKTTNRFYVSSADQSPVSTTQTINGAPGGTAEICNAIGAPQTTQTYMWMTGWNAKVGGG